jgi:peptidoglycan biosynthesis protein MviN/MurJ (putative lipid II flippase)
MRTHGVGGLAFATAICAYINVLMLSHKLRVRIGKMGIKKIIASSIKGLIAASIMGLISYEIIKLQFATLFISLIISIIAGIISFVVIAKLLKSPEIEQLLNSLYKKNNAKNS